MPRPTPPALLAVLVVLLASVDAFAQAAPARAADADDQALVMAKESFDLAEKSYALGKFDDALKQYERAFELKQLPALLFNIGQCHRNLGNWERAAFFYQGYLSREPKAKNREKVQALIEQMNAKVREQDEQRKAAAALAAANPVSPSGTPGVPSPGTGGNSVAPSVPDGAVPSAAAPSPAPPAEPTPAWRKWWVWTLVGVAVAGGVTAAVVATNPSVSTSNLNGSLGPPIDATR